MRLVRSFLLLCALSVSSSVFAQTIVVPASRFTVEHHNLPHLPVPALSLLSDIGGTTVFALTGFEYDLSHGPGGALESQVYMRILTDPRYEITGMELNATFVGTLEAESIPTIPGIYSPYMGEPNNFGAIGYFGHPPAMVDDLDGSVAVSVPMGSPGEYPFEIWGSVSAFWFYGGYWIGDRSYRLDAYATLEMRNPTLTIYTRLIPVPEPDVWAMLLAGLLPLSIRALRNKRTRRFSLS